MSELSAHDRPHGNHQEHSLKEAALQYARRGIPVFPVHSVDPRGRCTCGGETVNKETGEVIPCREGKPGKHPRVSGGFKAATTDMAQVEAWWAQWPDASIGMATGEVSGIDVIDDDRERKGLPLDGIVLPSEGPSVLTGGGGRHYHVRHRTGVRSRTNYPVPGIDIRGDGGYVILPPSNHLSGERYRWERDIDHALCDGPAWLNGSSSQQVVVGGAEPTEPKLSLSLIAGALAHATDQGFDPSDYDTWIKTGMALRHGYGDPGFEVWDDWSKRAPNYGKTAEKWLTFSSNGNSSGQVVTCEWILTKAIEKGWEVPVEATLDGDPALEDEKPQLVMPGGSGPAGLPQVEGAKSKSAEPEPYPLHLFPEAWGALTREVSSSLCSDPAIVATLMLVVFAAAIGYSRVLKDRYSGWMEPAAVWAAIVMDSGGRKSPAFRAVTAPLRSIQHDEYRAWKVRQDRYDLELAAWKLGSKKDRGEAPEPPTPLTHVYSTNATPEKLAEILGDQPRGTSFMPPELAGMFGALGYKKGAQALKDVALFLSSFGAEGAKYDRVMKGTVWIPAPLISIVGTIQSGLLTRLFSDEEMQSGLAARFLFLHRQPLPKKYLQGPRDESLKWWSDFVRWAFFQLQMRSSEDGETQEPLELDIEEDARDLLRDFVPSWDTESSRERGSVRAALAKLEGYALRFALLFRLLREHGGGAKETDPISREDLERGIELARWYRAEAFSAYEGLLADGRADRRSKLLLQIVRQHHGMVTPREWGRARSLTSAEAERELRDLVELGLLHAVQVGAGSEGRTTTAFVPVDPARLLSRPLSRPEVSSAAQAQDALGGKSDAQPKAPQAASDIRNGSARARGTDETPVTKGGRESGGPESPEPAWDEAAWQVNPLDALLDLLHRKGPCTMNELRAAARYMRTPEGQALIDRAVEQGDVVRDEAATEGRPRVLYREA